MKYIKIVSISLFLFFLFFLNFNSVKADEIIVGVTAEVVNLPVLTTTACSAITTTGATSGGNITSDGGSAVTARGVVWNTAASPTTALATKTSNGTGTGAFASTLTSLSASTTYKVRAYATNGAGDGYGNEINCSTPSLLTVTNNLSSDPTATVTSSAAGAISGTISCGSTCTKYYTHATPVTVTAPAKTGYSIAISNGCTATATAGNSAFCDVDMDAAKTVAVVYTATTPLLTVTNNRSADSTTVVTSSATGAISGTISCGSTCAKSYSYGTKVTVTAPAKTGYTIAISNGCTATATAGNSAFCDVDMDAAKTVAVVYTAANYTLTVTNNRSSNVNVTSSSTGAVSGTISCGTTCAKDYTSGSNVTVTAPLQTGYSIAITGGGCNVTATAGNPAVCNNITMDAAKTVAVVYTPVGSNNLTLTKAGLGKGTVTGVSNPVQTNINCGIACSSEVKSYTPATSVVLTATANTGSTFTGWSGACTNATGTCTVTMDTIKNVTATFKIPNLIASSITPLTAVSGVTRSFSSTISNNGDSGTGVQFPNLFQTATDASDPANPVGVVNFTGPILSPLINGAGTTASKDFNFSADTWMRVCADNTTTWTGSITESDEGDNCGNWVKIIVSSSSYNLTITKSGTGTGTVTGVSNPVQTNINCGTACNSEVKSYSSGTTVTLTGSPASGVNFTGWSGACTGTGSCVVSMTQARNVTATFDTIIVGPAVTLTASPTSVASGGTSTLTWVVSGSPTSCNAIALWPATTIPTGWSGPKTSTNGSHSLPVTVTANPSVYTIQCDAATSTATVTIGAAMTGTLTASDCSISAGNNSCNSNLNWSTTNPVATSSITTPTNITVANGNSGSATYSVVRGSRSFFLYNNGSEVTSASMTASCASGTSWNGNVCETSAGITGDINGIDCYVLAGNSKCNADYSWNTENYSGNPTSYVTDVSWNTLNSANSGNATISIDRGDFYLYLRDHNGNLLDFVQILATCNSGTTWNGTICSASAPATADLKVNGLTTDVATVKYNGSVNLTWVSTNASSCTLSGGGFNSSTARNADQSTSVSTPPLKKRPVTTITLDCNGATDDVNITVEDPGPIIDEN